MKMQVGQKLQKADDVYSKTKQSNQITIIQSTSMFCCNSLQEQVSSLQQISSKPTVVRDIHTNRVPTSISKIQFTFHWNFAKKWFYSFGHSSWVIFRLCM